MRKRFADHFSKQSATYAKARPRYPRELFEWIAGQVASREVAWDVGCGNGQTALSVAQYFDSVIATDASEAQIENAFPHPRISYQVGLAEESGLPAEAIGLITASAALHWFDRPRFFQEVDRVLKPGGLIAVWSYAGTRATEELDDELNAFAFETMKAYWPAGALLNWQGRDEGITLPYDFIEAPKFQCRENWTITQLAEYLGTWSSVQRFKEQHSTNPIDALLPKLKAVWKNETHRTFTWDLWFKAARKP